MMHAFPYTQVHLVGVKGVAMTSLAQILHDAGIAITGSDVGEDFVTKQQLDRLGIAIQTGFLDELPTHTQAVIYTAAHQAENNPQVQSAIRAGIATFSQAEAISFFANAKQSIAVCGVGGKSTVSAMITWILEWNELHPSFSVGVGNILGLDRTGAWRTGGHHFVVEADEYVTSPHAVHSGNAGIPRFSYLKPKIIVATNITFDHPDVYQDFAHTKSTFAGFFSKLPQHGTLVATQQVLDLGLPLPNCEIVIVSTHAHATFQYQYLRAESTAGISLARLQVSNTTYTVSLQIPGEYNMQNAICAIAAAASVGVSVANSIAALAEFRSTQRRFEYRMQLDAIHFYDDYAHHPSELAAVIQALKEWYPENKVLIAFQPHTFSRTRALLTDFAESLCLADTVVLLNIFASARESDDPEMSSQVLADTIRTLRPDLPVTVLPDYKALAQYFLHHLTQQEVVLTAGAGDIYQVYDEITT